MTSIKYIPLFQVDLLHSYFANGLCTALTLLPSNNCLQTMQQFGLKFLPKKTGGAVYGKVEKAGPDWRLPNKLPEALYLQFLLTSDNATFYPITQLPVGYKPGMLMVFSNLTNNINAGKPLLVKNAVTHQFSQQDIVEKAKGSFSFEKAAVADATIALVLQRNGQRLEVESPLYQGKVKASFNLAQSEAGFADLSINGVFEKTIYILPADAPGNTLGVVEVFYKSSLPNAYQFMTAAGIVNTKIYQLPFAAAQAKWRYKVKRTFNESITAITVAKPNPGGITFNTVGGPEPGTFISTSASAIALSDQPVKGITLKNQANKLIVSNLPNPALSQIVTDTDGAIYADMLVTV